MNHGLNITNLYTANRIRSVFVDSCGKQKEISGTCFFVSKVKDGKITFVSLITNRHCVDLDYNQRTPKYKDYSLKEIEVTIKLNNETTGLPTVENKLKVINLQGFIFHSNEANDVTCLNNPEFLYSIPSIYYTISYDYIADKQWIESNLTICDFVAFPGYPPWFDKLNNLPIIRMGTIASDPRFDYSWIDSNKGAVIGYEAFSYGGSSGSPVFAVQKGFPVAPPLSGGFYRESKLIGINAGHLDIEGTEKQHSGISYFYKSTIIKELIDRSI
jgi:Trypsin-like peptidase domain